MADGEIEVLREVFKDGIGMMLEVTAPCLDT